LKQRDLVKKINFFAFLWLPEGLTPYLCQQKIKNMKVKDYSDTSFLAKMVLLFVLVFVGQPSKRKAVETYLRGFLHQDTSTMGQVPTTKIATSLPLQSSISN